MSATTQNGMYSLQREDLGAWVEALLGEGMRVVAPVERRGLCTLRAVGSSAEVSLAPGKTQWSPKEFLFPRVEPLFHYETNGDGLALTDPEPMGETQVLFGVRPCDAAGLKRLDAILLQDPFYAHRRARTIVVAFACSEAGPECFCTAVGGSPAGEDGTDVLLAPLGDRWIVRVLTPKGETIVAPHRERWQAAAGDDWDRALEQAGRVADAMTRRAIPTTWAGPLEQSFGDAAWSHRASRCVGCSICTYVCPSCSCFDVSDEGSDACGTRCRTWDSCSFRLFTAHGSGHNPRPSQASRSRQRVLHKFAYYPLQHDGLAMCVGCGRCIALCPVGMDIHEEVLSIMSGRVPGEVKDAGD